MDKQFNQAVEEIIASHTNGWKTFLDHTGHVEGDERDRNTGRMVWALLCSVKTDLLELCGRYKGGRV